MEFKNNITITGKNYILADIQRGGSAIYKDDVSYLRIGDPKKIQKDLNLHKEMESYGFPVAKLLGEGRYEDMHYFIEESLGDNHFGQIFKNETEQNGFVSDKSFDSFMKVIGTFAKAQIKTISENQDWAEFRKGIHLDLICDELPDNKLKILNTYLSAEKKLKVFPFAIQHGDLTPFNVYPKGIIDLEDSFRGPVGYDLGSFTEIQNWFPEKSNDEFYKNYKLTDNQIKNYTETIDTLYSEHKLPLLSSYKEQFNLTKGIWFTVRMHALPDLQSYRYDLIKELIAKF